MLIYILKSEKQPYKLHTQRNVNVCNHQVILLMNWAVLFVVYFTASQEKHGYKKNKISYTEIMRDYFEHKRHPLQRETIEKT